MTIQKLQSSAEGTPGNMTGADIAASVNGLVDAVGLGFNREFDAISETYNILQDTLLSVTTSSNNSPTISNAVTITRSDFTKFELLSTRVSYLSTTAGYLGSSSPSGAPIDQVLGFNYDGQLLEFQFREIQGSFNLWVDGKIVALKSLTSALNQPRWYKVDFGSAKLRRIYIVGASSVLRGSMAIESNTNMYPTRTETPSIAMMGDSISAGTGSAFGLNMGNALRWKMQAWDMGVYGIGGSGYINNTANGRFIDRIQEIVDSNRDYVIIAGGINDVSVSTPAEFQTAIDAFYTELLTHYNSSQIIIVSNFSTGATVDDDPIQTTALALKAKAAEIGAFFIDAIRDEAVGGWITAENQFLLGDGVHPDNDGHLLYGHNIAMSLLSLPIRL